MTELPRHFDPNDWPHGLRCACCWNEFTAGDVIVDRTGRCEGMTTPTCAVCARDDAPLAPGHPFLGGSATLLANGRVRVDLPDREEQQDG